ncbi:MAG: MarR family transcriptional regulator, partial [Afipia sp.]
PNFVAMLDELESRDLCVRVRSSSDRRSHILRLTEKGRAVLSRARKLIETRHEARLRELLGNENRDLLLAMLGKIAQEF